jgi:hypothetical protein
MARTKTSAITTRCWNTFISWGSAGLVEAAAALQRQLAADHRLIEREDPWSRGILILGLDAPSDKLRAGFAEAAATR